MKNLLFIFFILNGLFPSSTVVAQNKEKEAQEYIDKSFDLLYSHPKQASFYASKAIELFPEEQPNDLKARAMLAYSQSEKLLGNFDLSINIAFDALKYITPDNKMLRGELYSLMSMLYCSLTDYNKAIELNEKGTSIFKASGDSAALAICLNDRGIIHCYLNEFNTAEQFFQQALKINRSLKNLKKVAANLNNLCLYEGNSEEKLGYINEAIIINKNLKSNWSLAENYNNMAKQSYYAKHYQNALNALKTAYEIATQIGAKELICDNYEYSSWVYAALGRHKEAYHCLQQLYTLSKDLQNGSKLRNIEQEISYKKIREQQRITESKEQAYRAELFKRNFILTLIILLSLIVFIALFSQWYKRKKNMQLMSAQYQLEQSEHKLVELKVRQQELELKATQNALSDSRQEAVSFAIFLQSRNDLLEKIREMIKQGYKMKEQDLVLHLKKINAFIGQCQSNDKTNSTFLLNVEEKNQAFLQRLSELHPNLTQGEKHLATLLRANLSTKDISMLTGTIPKTVNMNRYRLRKALNLSSEEDLTDYLQNI